MNAKKHSKQIESVQVDQLGLFSPCKSVPRFFLGTNKTASILLLTFLFVGVVGFTAGERAWGHDVDEGIKDEDVAFPERFMARGGIQYLFGVDVKYRFDGPIGGFGTTVDLDDIGGDDTDTAPRVDALFRFNPRHSIGFSWYDISLDGDAGIDDTLTIDDQVFAIGTNINTDFDLSLYRLFYNYSFYHSKKTEIYLSVGTYVGDIDFVIRGQGTITNNNGTGTVSGSTRIKEDLFYPLPSAGFGFNYLIMPKLSFNVRGDVFYVNVDDLEGSMAEMYFGLEYRLFKHFALGAAYDRVAIDVEWKKGKSGGFDIDGSWNGAYGYAAVYW